MFFLTLHMVLEPVVCPACSSDDVVRHGHSRAGQQRYKGRKHKCHRSTCIRAYADRASLPQVKQPLAAMAVKGSGMHDTARVLKSSPTTVLETLKKRPTSESLYWLLECPCEP